MFSSRLKVLLLSLAGVLIVSLTVPLKSAKPYFSVTRAAPESVRAGSAAILNIPVTHRTNRTTVFGSGFCEDEGRFGFDFNSLTSEGRPAAETRSRERIRDRVNGWI